MKIPGNAPYSAIHSRFHLRILLGSLLLLLAASGVLTILLIQNTGGALPLAVDTAPKMPPGWYFGKGQWKADARTLYAAARFVLIDTAGPDLPLGTNFQQRPRPTTLIGTNAPEPIPTV